MIRVTTLTGRTLWVNAELIATLEETPDTIITLTTGRKLVVAESARELVDRFIAYRRRTLLAVPRQEVK